VSNELQRNFHADKPNEKWLTDITEFAIPAGKVYLSPILDYFNGMVPYWTNVEAPDASLVNSMLDQAISGLGEGKHPPDPFSQRLSLPMARLDLTNESGRTETLHVKKRMFS